MKLKLLDRYIIGKFLGTYIFAIVLILAITIMLDINEKLDSFLKAPLKETVFDYFLNFLPYFANQFSPLFTFIAVIFFTSKLADNSEIIAMLSAGMSYKRLLVPYMLSAAVIASATFVLSAYIIPPANVKRIAYQNTYVKNKAANLFYFEFLGVIVLINTEKVRYEKTDIRQVKATAQEIFRAENCSTLLYLK